MLALPLLVVTLAAAPPPFQSDALEKGSKLLADQEIEAAAASLEEALHQGPYSHGQVVQLFRDLGIARSYLEDQPGAEKAFTQLLQVDPAHALPYTISPRASFVFENVRDSLAGTPRTAIHVELPTTLEPQQALVARVVVDANPLQLTHAIVHAKIRGAKNTSSFNIPIPKIGEPVPVELMKTPGDIDELPLEITISGLDAGGWETHRSIPLQRDIVVVHPPPWYASPWFWGGVGAAAVVVTGTVVTFALWPQPTESPYEIVLREEGSP